MEKSPLKPVPSGSLPSPVVKVNGAPVSAVTMAPSSQPFTTLLAMPEENFALGRSQIRLPTATLRRSKSQAPIRYDFCSSSGTAIEFRYVSPVTGAELRSRHLLQ